MLAIDVDIDEDALTGTEFGLFGLRELNADGAPVDLEAYWIPDPLSLFSTSPISDLSGLGFSAASDTVGARLTPSFDGSLTDRVQPPVVISQALAEDFGLEVGDRISFFLENAFDRTDAEVAGILPAIPGAADERAVLLDLGLVLHAARSTTTSSRLERSCARTTATGSTRPTSGM